MFAPFIINLLFAHSLMFGVWLIYKRQKIPMIADVFWSLGITIQALIYCLYNNNFPSLLILLIVWSIRLATFLYITRLKKQHQDPRYQSIEMSASKKPEHTFLINFQIQAFLQFMLGLVWYFISLKSIPIGWTIISSIVVITGLMIEISADHSLERFKREGKGVCQLGLWRYSRHPNYFGELLLWFGFSVASSHFGLGLIGLLSPLTLTFIMRFITGPLSEELSLKHKGQSYREYQKRTPMILPYKLFSFKRDK
jgi:steroid 5-alpha reductase family enzyme